MLCSSSLLCVYARTHHIQHFLQENIASSCFNHVDSKIDCRQACKLIYKVIWLGYEDTEDESEWIPVSELTYTTDLVSDFHIAYPTKPGPLLLSWTHCCICSLSLCISNRDFPSFNFFSIFCPLIFINPQLPRTFQGFFSELSSFFLFNSYFSYSHI